MLDKPEFLRVFSHWLGPEQTPVLLSRWTEHTRFTKHRQIRTNNFVLACQKAKILWATWSSYLILKFSRSSAWWNISLPAFSFIWASVPLIQQTLLETQREKKKREQCFRICLDDFSSPVDTAAQHRSSRNPEASVSGTGVSFLEWMSTGQRAKKLQAYSRPWHLVLVRPWMNNSLLCEPVFSTVKWACKP